MSEIETNFMGIRPQRDTETSRQTEIGNFQSSSRIDQLLVLTLGHQLV